MKKLLFAVAAVGFILVLQPADNAQAEPGDKTVICHITGASNGSFTGHVIHVSDNAVKAHCRHGVGDHNPVIGNAVIGNFCNRGKANTNPLCQKGCFANDTSGCR